MRDAIVPLALNDSYMLSHKKMSFDPVIISETIETILAPIIILALLIFD